MKLAKSEIPIEIERFYEVSDAIVEYPVTEEYKQKLYDFINKVIPEIEKDNSEENFPPIAINDKNSFFCNTLCNQKDTCKYLQSYKENYKKEEKQKTDEALELFG